MIERTREALLRELQALQQRLRALREGGKDPGSAPRPAAGEADVVRTLLDAAPVGVALTDREGRYRFANRSFERMHALTPGTALGRRAADLFPGDVAAAYGADARAVLTHNAPVDREQRLVADGAPVVMAQVHFPVPGADSLSPGVGLIGMDITARKLAEQGLEASESRYRSLVEQPDVIPWEAGADRRFRYVGPQSERILGYPAARWREPGFWADCLHPDDREWVRAYEQATVERGEDHTVEYRMVSADGRAIWLRDLVSVETDARGEQQLRGFMIDISAVKEGEAALREAIRSADLANRAKTEFLANMSHELRTPLNAIIGFAETIEDEILGPLGTVRYRDYARDIKASAVHLLGLINEILDLAKIESGRFELHDEPVTVAEVVEEAWRLVRPRAESGGIAGANSVPANFPRLRLDRLKFKQIVLNLLSNAVKFTPAGGSVAVGAEILADGDAAVSVTDTGIGMSEEEVAVALEMFRQVDSSFSRRFEGTGLGLPLTQKLAELHGGRLQIDSEKGRGTTVRVIFPAARVLAA